MNLVPNLPNQILEPTAEMNLILQARHHNPFSVLGVHACGGRWIMTVYRPHSSAVWLEYEGNLTPLQPIADSGIYQLLFDKPVREIHPTLVENCEGVERSFIDPYTFSEQTHRAWLSQFNQGDCFDVYRFMGAHHKVIDSVSGVLFLVWAPNAERVSVVGDFNCWDGRVHSMRCLGDSGVWELFIPGLPEAVLYKYEIRQRYTGTILTKTDPYGRYFEAPPQAATWALPADCYGWRDHQWCQRRQGYDWLHEPMSVYEVHLGSWKRSADGEYLSYRQLAAELIPYVVNLGFTHIELMPVMEFPFDGSWGYQVTGYFAPTSRFGSIDDFKYFIDQCHLEGIGVLLDWVPAHFPKDAYALARFDGSALYEHENPLKGEHKDWGTLIFNFGRNEVRNFLVSSACFWLDEFHLDGLRVDAVASMLYLDYSREPGEWERNKYGGNENLEAVDFIRRVNEAVHREFPGVLMIAEESTSWPQVSRPVYLGGLGFSMKWNMGWMNDSLRYFALDPIHREYHHDKLTFTQLYAYSENFVLPLSHDEVVHGKRSLLEKMPGDAWQQFANVRLLLTYQFCHPGKKLLFMGNEFAQGREWNHDRGLDWPLLQFPFQHGVQTLVKDLNNLYRNHAALNRFDFEAAGFAWIDCHDYEQSVISFLRKSDSSYVIVVLNFTPVVRYNYRIGVPVADHYAEILNSDSAYYGGSDVSNGTWISTEAVATMGYTHSLVINLPPLAGLILEPR